MFDSNPHGAGKQPNNGCGVCKNCVHVAKQRKAALRAVTHAQIHRYLVSGHVVYMWNETLKHFPCTENEQ